MKPRAGLLFLFFFSGLTSLIYEIAWTRILSTILGNTSLAVSVVVSIFMAGLAIGSFAAAKRALRRPILLYGFLEGFIGLYAILTPGISDWIEHAYTGGHAMVAGNFLLSVLFKAIIAACVLLLPTIAMGATLPILVRAFPPEERSSNAGWLYGINTAGAVTGTLLAGYFLLPHLGISNTIYLSALFNAFLLLAAFQLNRNSTPDPAQTSTARAFHPLYLLPLITGFATLCYEILWTRALSMFFGSSVYAFSSILAAFLLGIASGSSYYAKRIPEDADPYQFFSLIHFRLSLSAIFFAGIFMGIPGLLIALFHTFYFSFPLYQAAQFLLIGAVVFYTTFLSGAAFPGALHFFRQKQDELQIHAGYVYSYNTMGCILGSLCAGFILIPALGVERSIRVVALINLLLGIFCFRKIGGSKQNFRVLAIGGVSLLLLIFLPRWNQSIYNGGFYAFAYKYVPQQPGKPRTSLEGLPLFMEARTLPKFESKDAQPELNLLYYGEGLTANVAVAEDIDGVRSLLINGKPDASNVPTGDMRTQLLLGHLPLFFTPNAHRALVIGLGSGVTAGAMSTHGLDAIDCVEIEKKVVEASEYYKEENLGILQKPHFRLIVDDARNFVQQSNDTYDVITSEPSNLWMSGVSNLFTQEFFQSLRARLRPGGVLCQWLHLYQISSNDVLIFLKTIHSAFPRIAIFVDGSDMLVLASDQPLRPDPQSIATIETSPAVHQSLTQSELNATNLLQGFISDERIVQILRHDLPINTDDHPVLEFSAPRSLFLNHSELIVHNLKELNAIANANTGGIK